ncbi:MAG: hypothetical protein Q7K42_04070, partial [Candidatus Diapherotrites archaeon]|nr:hypothetical protein [Candidatus Diapherotrites archaeon]
IVTKKGKFMIELLGTNSISFPIKLEKELLVQEDYLQKVLEIANKKMSQNLEHREKFQALCLKELK